ncbi:MAG: hypothetical protein ISN29_07100 [Gammaproteobacteria bacterium AqS3]|nr:hypothetical protein [Gammaproteobacteria bacterium AqS3]
MELGYSYGLTAKTEIGLNLDGSYTDDRNADPRRGGGCFYVPEFGGYFGFGCRDEKDTTARLGTLRAQISRSLSPENESPGMVGWIGIDLLENRSQEGEDFKPVSGAFNAGFSLYRTYDPIVLRVVFGYAHIPPEHIRGIGRWDRGDTISVSPSLLFAVNNVVSISATSNIQVTFSDTLNRQDNCNRCNYRRTVVSTGLGVSLLLWDRTTVYISGSTIASGDGGASFGAFIRHRLKKAEGSWWGRYRARVGGIAAGMIAGASIRDLTR